MYSSFFLDATTLNIVALCRGSDLVRHCTVSSGTGGVTFHFSQDLELNVVPECIHYSHRSGSSGIRRISSMACIRASSSWFENTLSISFACTARGSPFDDASSCYNPINHSGRGGRSNRHRHPPRCIASHSVDRSPLHCDSSRLSDFFEIHHERAAAAQAYLTRRSYTAGAGECCRI